MGGADRARARRLAVMRRLYLDPDELPDGLAEGAAVRLDGDRVHRLRDVLRLEAGVTIAVFDGRGAEREATLASVDRAAVTLRLGAAREAAPEPPVPVTLVCGFPRGRRGDWLVEKATELGVAAIAPLATERSVLRPGDGRVERWRRIAIEAAEQSGRAIVPAFAEAPPPGALCLLADLGAAPTVAEALAAVAPPGAAGTGGIALYVGPEGGWSDEERVSLLAAGARPVTLGPRRLRVETAAVAGLAQVLAATGDR
jgi:16S rRNA (uracil1498-N3)-methyltransferase